MATTLNPPSSVGAGVWRYTWTGTAPFRVFRYDTYEYQYTETELTELTVTSATTEPPAIEVFDSTETADPTGLTYPAKAILQWRGYKYASYYSIQKYNGSTYDEVSQVGETGRGYYQFTAPIPSDDTATDVYRVVNVDISGATTNTDVQVTIIRNPDPPLIEATYDSNTNTISFDLA